MLTCHTGAVRGYFVPSDKLHDAVDTDGTVSQLINENICRVHIFKGNAVRSVVELGPPAWLVPAFALASRLARA